MRESKMEPNEFLEDGKILSVLLNEHDLFRDENSFIAILNCLSDNPPVWVPMTVRVSDEDVANILEAGVGGTVTTKHGISMKPDLLKNPEGELFFPAFSMREEAPEAYRNRFSWVRFYMSDCVRFVLQANDLKGLVLNAFTNSVVLPNSLLEVLGTLYGENKE